ncbi:MAG: gamma-glutamylcyclotransferase [Ilumatobacteraceae bacterium]
MITDLFVYGTLRPGQERWPILEPFVTGEGHDDSAGGQVYDTGHGYPAARFDVTGTIHGRVYSLCVERLHEALQLLDEVEGAVVDLFRRVAITTATGTDAWAYEYCGDTKFTRIESGNWLDTRRVPRPGDWDQRDSWDSEVGETLPRRNST